MMTSLLVSRHALLLLAASLALLGAAPLAAQTPRIPVLERGPELERLDFLVGEWQGRLTRFRPDGGSFEVRSTLSTGWSLGDAWLESRDRTELDGGTVIHNRTQLTWDAREGVYTGAWQDNVLAGLVLFQGRFLDERRLELDTGEFELFGRSHRVVFTYTRVSENEFTTEMRQGWDGAEPRKVATGTFERSDSASAAMPIRKPGFGSLNPAAPPETAQFDFAIGEWSCTTRSMQPDGTLQDGPPANWTFYYILDGWAIQDDWVSSRPDGSKFHGTNVRSFNPQTGKWDNRWLSMGNLEWKYFESEQVGDTMVMTGGRGKDGQGREFVDRNVFHAITEDSWSWRKDRSFDGGESWLEGVVFIDARRVR